MMFGVVLVGTYTSIFIAAPILIYLGVGTHRLRRRNRRRRSNSGSIPEPLCPSSFEASRAGPQFQVASWQKKTLRIFEVGGR